MFLAQDEVVMMGKEEDGIIDGTIYFTGQYGYPILPHAEYGLLDQTNSFLLILQSHIWLDQATYCSDQETHPFHDMFCDWAR